MPWVDRNDCDGCGVCIEECPVGAITLLEDRASIDNHSCIRCATCHEVCPQEAVKHDSKKVPEEIRANIERVGNALEHFDSEEEKQACLTRWMKFFNKEKKVVEQTLSELESLKTQ